MIPLTGSGMVQVTLTVSDERTTAEVFLGADGADEEKESYFYTICCRGKVVFTRIKFTLHMYIMLQHL